MPDFTVIEGGGPDKGEREREFIRDDLSWAFRELTANVLRIVRGAGKPHALLEQMEKVLSVSLKYRDLHGYWPYDLAAKSMRCDDEYNETIERARAGEIDQQSVDRWREDGTFERMHAEHTICRGALQTIASTLIGQTTQRASGNHELYEGVRELNRVRGEQNRKYAEEVRASRLAERKAGKKKRKRKPASSNPDVR